jgi:beta-amylase
MTTTKPILGLKKILLCLCWLAFGVAQADPPEAFINVMAPLFVGVPSNTAYLDDLNHDRPTMFEADWMHFREELFKARAAGVSGVSVDVWWGLVQKRGPNAYDWGYYRRLFGEVRKVNEEIKRTEGPNAKTLSIKVIMSTHRCGTNIGDNVFIGLPEWIWAAIDPTRPKSPEFKSESGKGSEEYISFWATEKALPYYASFWSAFLGEFRDIADSFNAISISLGPSGELHYPAYHVHDGPFDEAHWPRRGFFQGSGAKADYIQYLKVLYPTLPELNKAFGSDYPRYEEVYFPGEISASTKPYYLEYLRKRYHQSIQELNRHLGTSFKDFEEVDSPYLVTQFFSEKLRSPWLRSPEGVALFDWYSGSLQKHFKLMLATAADLVWRDKDFGKTPVSFKIPGIHWERDHLAELMNGLISVRSLMADEAKKTLVPNDGGYGPLFQTIASVQKAFEGHHFDIYTTAGAFPDGLISGEFSRGKSIVSAQAALAKKLGLTLKLENAMAEDLHSDERMKTLTENLELAGMTGVTLLRLSDFLLSRLAQKTCQDWLKRKDTLSNPPLSSSQSSSPPSSPSPSSPKPERGPRPVPAL